MQNPWSVLPKKSPYVLAEDSDLVERFNAMAPPNHRFDTSLLPEPFFGSLAAPVLILNLNPGWSPDDAQVHANRRFASMARRSMEHALSPYPFLHLQPETTTPGGRWWQQRTQRLALVVGFDAVAQNISCVQFAPYHSAQYAATTPRLPSQEYSFWLVKQAIARGAEIVVMRSVKLWLNAVPELNTYKRLHLGLNPRAPYISPGNLGPSFDILVRRICPSGSAQTLRP